MNLHIVGLGGIGSHMLLPMLQYLNFEKNIFDVIMFIDGDDYEEKNLTRQNVLSIENKALSNAKYYREMFTNLSFSFIDKYINDDNFEKIFQEKDVILLCVDNNKTRKLFEDKFEEYENLTLISGGNELTDGNVMIMQKVNGVLLTPKFSEMHPELTTPTDKNPDEMSCEELEVSEPQISIVNATIADSMRRILFAMISGRGVKFYETFINCMSGKERALSLSDNETVLKIEVNKNE